MNSEMLQKLAAELWQWQTWVVLGVVAAAGILGGIARKATAAPTDGAASKMDPVVGAITALAMLMVIPLDSTLVVVIGISIVAGFAGKSLLDALRARIEAMAAQKAAAEANVKRNKAVETGLVAVAKGQQLASEADQIVGSLTPEMRVSLAGKARLLIRESADASATVAEPSAAAELAALERDLLALRG